MSQISDTGAADANPLIQRLVVGRLASPGVLNRNQLHDTFDRHSQPPTRHTPRYVLRATEALPPSAPGLPFARIARPSDQGAPPAGETGSAARAPGTLSVGGSFGGPAPTAPAMPTTPSTSVASGAAKVAASLSTPTIARTPLVLNESPRAVSRVGATRGALMSSNNNGPDSAAIPASFMRAAPGHRSVMRTADGAITVAQTAHSSTHSVGTRAAAFQASPDSSPSSQLSGSSRSALPILRQRPGATAPDHSSAVPLVRVVESRPAAAVSSSPSGGLGIWPQIQSSPRIASPGVMRTPAPLVFRQPEPLAAASNAAPLSNTVKPPAITTAVSSVVAREAAGSKWAHNSAHPKAHGGVSHYAEAPKLEQIIGRVERHLARDLEIESERQGVWQWR